MPVLRDRADRRRAAR